jgi:hypothetical protein
VKTKPFSDEMQLKDLILTRERKVASTSIIQIKESEAKQCRIDESKRHGE